MDVVRIKEGEETETKKPKKKKWRFIGLFFKVIFKFFGLGLIFFVLGVLLISYNTYRGIRAEFQKTKPKDNVTQTVFFDRFADVIYESYGRKNPKRENFSTFPG